LANADIFGVEFGKLALNQQRHLGRALGVIFMRERIAE